MTETTTEWTVDVRVGICTECGRGTALRPVNWLDDLVYHPPPLCREHLPLYLARAYVDTRWAEVALGSAQCLGAVANGRRCSWYIGDSPRPGQRVARWCHQHEPATEAERETILFKAHGEARDKVAAMLRDAERTWAAYNDSVVYVIGEPNGDVVKIGYTTHLPSRLASLSRPDDQTIRPDSVNPKRLEVLATKVGPPSLERIMHAACRDGHVVGEWFAVDAARTGLATWGVEW